MGKNEFQNPVQLILVEELYQVNVIIIKPAATGFYEGHILVSRGTALHCEVLDRTHNERWLQRSAPVDSWKPGRWHDPAVLRKEDFLRNVRLL